MKLVIAEKPSVGAAIAAVPVSYTHLVLYPIGGKPNPYPAGIDDFQYRYFRPLYGARTVPKRRSLVLRPKRPFQQHDFVRQETAEKPKRLDFGYTRQRQEFFCKARDHQRFSHYRRRYYHCLLYTSS